jgi:hypothetical protein
MHARFPQKPAITGVRMPNPMNWEMKRSKKRPATEEMVMAPKREVQPSWRL